MTTLDLEKAIVAMDEYYDAHGDELKDYDRQGWMQHCIPQLRGLTKGHLLQRIANARRYVKKHGGEG